MQVPGNEAPCRGSFSPKTRAVYLGNSTESDSGIVQIAAQGRVDRCYRGDTTAQVATPPTASEFRRGIIGVTLRPVSGADFASPITDEHLLQQI